MTTNPSGDTEWEDTAADPFRPPAWDHRPGSIRQHMPSRRVAIRTACRDPQQAWVVIALNGDGYYTCRHEVTGDGWADVFVV